MTRQKKNQRLWKGKNGFREFVRKSSKNTDKSYADTLKEFEIKNNIYNKEDQEILNFFEYAYLETEYS